MMNRAKLSTCPVCCEGSLCELTYTEIACHNGHSGEINLCISKCNLCNSELPTDAQLLKNRRAILAFEKKADNLLQGSEVRNIRLEFELTQSQASIVFGGGRNAFSKYESDDVSQSNAMDKLLRLCREVPAAYDWLVSDSGLPIKQRSIPSLWKNFHVQIVEDYMHTPIEGAKSVTTTIKKGQLHRKLLGSKIMKQHVEYHDLALPISSTDEVSAIPAYSDEVYNWLKVKGIHA